MVATRQMTAADLWSMQTEDLQDFELIEGELIPMVPPGGTHGRLQISIGAMLHEYVKATRSGTVFGETGFVLDHGEHTVLAPDIAYVSASRLPADQTKYLKLAPEIAVEIISPGNSPGEIERKIAIYLRAGVQLVWVIYPSQRQVVVHSPGEAPRIFGISDILPGDGVLPGFSVPVAEIFS
ncbi:MAG: Uma2 family endonuclease [Thermomicrobiales bacterium]|nr:Uma2 family endonuclease [Thermomicrobiales bacterium]